MKTKIVGLVLVVMAVAIPMVVFVLPSYIPNTDIWWTIFAISIYSGAGLAIGISISLILRLTKESSIACSLAGLFVCFSAGLFCLTAPFTFWVISIAITMEMGLIASAVIFLIKGTKFIFFSN